MCVRWWVSRGRRGIRLRCGIRPSRCRCRIASGSRSSAMRPAGCVPRLPGRGLDLSVRDGVGREPRVGFRMHGVLVAPPAHRLDPPAPGTGPGAGAASRGCVACGYEGPRVQKDGVGMIRQKTPRIGYSCLCHAALLLWHECTAKIGCRPLWRL